ncbi:N-acetylneuraminate synthase [Helicobacter cinaedi]|uniref:N-acetylneuraminate synthase n=1 Tax=Helicobacter cinaedi CCUG 18818 = ATCC BAA-847 TaxID=537971 RepID=A0AAI8MNA6_9HELI|nr:N-acetylneuraminate synthase [Helicobacter cinaedi]EFR46602.1 N-acetylneuraminate synthase [Helicobacter cinaedi CCUG 18818 = ATCC BAA-847]QOQ89849.1 N-acetylneuraminate synthase [Helicobacter cinaedi]BAM32062.1 N-acetylneuraminate synthase [Helicobacter cinaedi CCUG 18818 = ATCC BAA-847]
MSKVLIIAEAGVNHNGNIDIAKKLVDVAAESGADIVKFQTAKAENVVSRFAKKAEYQIENTGNGAESQLEMIQKLVLDDSAWSILIDYCKQKNIKFLSTPFDLESVDLLHNLGLKIFKIPSGEITNLPYLRKIGKYNKQVILSTGMANLGEIESAIAVLVDSGTKRENITLLQCNTEYPTPFADVNLKAMKSLKKAFRLPVGYSDHTPGIAIPLAAVGMGAKVIEKHFTLDKNMEGPDHKASLEPCELKAMVQGIREIELALGDGIKQTSASEAKNKPIARKSIVANCAIKKGEILSESNLYTKRPAGGISPMEWDKVIGTKAVRDFEPDEMIEL